MQHGEFGTWVFCSDIVGNQSTKEFNLKNQSVNAFSSQWTWSNHKWNLGIIRLYWLKCLGLPNKTLSCQVSALKVSKTVQHDKNVLGGFKDYYSNLAGKLSKKLPKPPNKFTLNTVFQHYKGTIQSDSFNLATVSESTILTISKNNKVSKTASLGNLSGRFLKDGGKVLAKPITELCNLSITSGKFPDSCKIAKLKPIYKKSSLTGASNYRPISLLQLISKVIKKVFTIKLAPFSTLEIYYTIINMVFTKIIPLTSASPF